MQSDSAQIEVTSALRVAASKLRRTRALEAAGVALAAGGFALAVVQVAWAIALAHPLAGGAAVGGLALVGIPAGIFYFRRAGVQAGGLLAAMMVLAGMGLAGAVVAFRMPLWLPRAVPPAFLLVLAAGAGLLVGAVKVRGLRPAAILLDRRGRLRQRALTAVEMMASREADPAVLACICGQLRDLLLARRPQDGPFWQQGRPMLAVLALSLTLAVGTFLLPTWGLPTSAGLADAIADSLGQLSAADKQALAQALRQEARQEDRSAMAEDLDQAARVVEIGDEQKLRELLRKLEAAGVRLGQIAPERVLAAAGATGGAGQGSRPAPAERANPSAGAPIAAPGQDVRVFVPEYVGKVAETPTTAPGPSHAASEAPFATAWQTYRTQAGDALSRGQVPARYRRIVQDYFGIDR